MEHATVPDLATSYPLSDADVAAFQRDGHILLRSVCTPEEIARYHSSIVDAAMRLNTEHRSLAERTTYGKAFLQVINLWEHDAAVKRFVFARRFAEIAARLLGVSAVRLYQDQALFKEGSGGYTPWHQDQHYWPLDTDKTVTMWMPLIDVTPDMGPMTFVSGSQRDGYLAAVDISDESEHYFERLIRERNLRVTEPPTLMAGDATFHTGWTLHRAAPNLTGKVREVITIIYYPDGTHVSEITPGNTGDAQRFLANLRQGDVAAGPLTPLLYSACDDPV